MSTDQIMERLEALEARVAGLEGTRASVDENRLGAFQKHSATSRLAAVSNYPRSGSQRARILEYLTAQGQHGATRQEIAAALCLSDDSVRPRVVELGLGGWVRGSDRTRRTPLGEQAEVLVATERTALEIEATIKTARQDASPSPVVSDEPGVATGTHGHALGDNRAASGSSETTALFDPRDLSQPSSAIHGDYDAA